MGLGKQLSKSEVGKIRVHSRAGYSIRNIAEEIGRSKTAVFNVLSKGDSYNSNYFGRPRQVLSDRDKHVILTLAATEQCSVRKIQREIPVSVSHMTLYNVLTWNETIERAKRDGQPTQFHKDIRVERAKTCQSLDKKWGKVNFSDEKKFSLDGPDSFQYYWHDIRTRNEVFSKRQHGYGNGNDDKMIEIVQQFREFKPYLKKRLAYIKQSGRALELQEEVEDIEFYLEVMKDILADESHGVDQLRSFIDKIHEMIRKNPLTDLPNSKRRSLDGEEDEYGDNDRPRSPSPERRGSDSAANIPLIPTHGAHRTVEVNFSSRNEHAKAPKNEDAYDEWGRPNFENSFTRREPYKDVDMRGGYYPTSAIGRGQRRWSEEGDFSGARGVGRGLGVGRGAPMPHHRNDEYRQDLDIRQVRGRGFNDNDHDRRNDYFLDRNRTHDSSKERERDLKPPEWFTGGPSNGNSFDEWQPKSENRDSCYRTEADRRSREDEWRMNHSETRERDEKFHHAQHIAKYFERRPSSEVRREERTDDYISMFDRRSRNDRPHDSSGRHEMSSPHSDYSHGRRGHGDFHGRGRKEDDRHDSRSRMDGGPQYPPPNTAQPLINPMNSISMATQPASMPYGVPQPPPHYVNTGLLPPPSPFSNANPPLLPLPVPNAPNVGMGLGMQNIAPPMAPGVAHPMGFQQPPPTPNFPMSPDMHSNQPGYRLPPPHPHPQPRPPMPPSPMRTPAPHHTPEHYQGVPSGSPNYASPVEPSAEQVREITMMKAKQCFGRVVSRSPCGSSTQHTPGLSTMNNVSPGPMSPNNSGSDNQNSCALDPRLNRSRPGAPQTVQNRQQSPLATAADPPPRSNPSTRPDAGNVLRPSSSDPRSKNKIEQERKRLQDTRERTERRHDGNKSSNNAKGSKIQELRKQFEKEGFHRLGRPAPKKQSGSFEDAITVTYDEESDASNQKAGEKSKSSSSHGKEKEADTGRESRSQTDKTEREKSPKRKSGDKNSKAKERASTRSTNNVDKKKDKESTNERSPRRKSGQNEKLDKTDKGIANSSRTSKTSKESETTETSEKVPPDPTKPPTFKIPRKPKPKEPDVEPLPPVDDLTSEVPEKDVCTSPPASPEPALSQVPDVESRTESTEDIEMRSSSTKSTTEEPPSSSDVNQKTLESLKKFLMVSADEDEREFFMSNPDNLKQFFLKIKSEMSAAKGSRNEEGGTSQTASGDTDQEKNQPPEEDEPERGRSREKKKNAKRRSSLEKLHDALKEMRFDTMLPLGPRRCTRGGQDEAAAAAAAAAAETVEPEANTSQTEEEKEVKAVIPVDKLEEETEKSQPTKKRGRPPKDSPKSTRGASKLSVTEDSEVETIETEQEETVPEEKTPVRRGKKRKLKPTKVNPRKRTKKSGPITRAQAALKKTKDTPKTTAEQNEDNEGKAAGVTTRKKNKAQNNVVLRRLTRKRVGANDTVVNKGLCKIKLESDFMANVKPEPPEIVDPFLNTSVADVSNEHLADQLANIINENLDNVVANLDKQTEENMDLDVFNTLDGDADDNTGDVCVKDEMEISMEEEPSSEISYEAVLNESATSTPKKGAKSKASPIPVSPADASTSDAIVTTPSLIEPPAASTTTIEAPNQPLNSTDEVVQAPSNSAPETLPSESSDPSLNASEEKGEPEPSDASASNDVPASSDAPASSDVGRESQPDADIPTTKGSTCKNQSSRIVSEKKETLLLGEDDSSCLSANSSSSAASAFKSDMTEDTTVKTEAIDSSSDFDMDELRKDVFSNKCDKCNFSGKKIVAHYVNKHYPCNIPQARLMPETFNGLIELNTSESPQLLEIVLDETQAPVWPCLYCDDRHDCIVDFYDHLTSHTGEFRYECGECGTSYPHHKSLVNHVKIHKGVSKNCIRFTFESVIEKSSKELSGFLCNDCFYFQLRFESIIRHIEQTGHSSLDVKSVRLIRPSANSRALEPNSKVVAVKKVPKESETPSSVEELKIETTEGSTTKSSEVIQQDPINEKENECVFFGTNVSFTPTAVPTGECNFIVPRVFEETFLRKLMKKVTADGDGDESPPGGKSKRGGVRKRKRNESGHETSMDCTPPEKLAGTIDTLESSTNQKSSSSETGNPENICTKGVKIRKTYPKQKTKLHWDAESDESFVEEPNDFLLSSDEESSDESECSDGSYIEDVKGTIEVKDPEFEGGLQNNEHIVKTRRLRRMEKWDDQYFKKHELVTIRRSGDLYSPNTVLFGYIRSGVSKTSPHKLRDHKEVDKLSHVYGARVLPVKCIPKLNEMITNTKLMHLFKCMSSVCSYTTDNPTDFLNHLSMNHYTNLMLVQDQSCSRFLAVREVVMMKDADCCAYCSARYRDARDLVDHIINQHSQSPFQCNRCFYRSFYQRYVVRHFEVEHPGEPLHVLKCLQAVEAQSEEATLFQIFVYKCDIENPLCDKTKRYVFREDFTEHLEKCGPGLKLYPCHLCKTSYSLDELIEHYKTHNLFKFHCSYCAFGSEVKADLDEHFVFIHPNTSGRVFYRVKPSPTSTAPKPIFPIITKKSEKSPRKKSSSIEGSANTEETKYRSEGPVEGLDASSVENQASADNSGMDVSENEDNEKGRLTNLKGGDLYRCVTGDCDFVANDGESFKEHVNACSFVAESRSLSCAHCERKMKTATNLLEHMKVHGEKKHVCSLCSFRCWTSAEITKHIKAVHRVASHKLIKKEVTNEVDPDLVAYPKDVMTKSLCTYEVFENNYYSYAKKARYSFDNIDKLPLNKIFSSDLNCALCPYATKVRSNMVRHLNIHKQSIRDGTTVVPSAQRINPVPYLSREGLEFDKMMNLAASSHKTDGAAAESDVKKLPQFVKEQFRYVCSVCDHMTSDEALLQTHIKVIHSEVTTYKCPHCQKNQESKDNPDNAVPLDKIAFHLKLHGPKLYKCGHCMIVHHQLRLMEKHIPEKHPEKKPIHYLIRDLDLDGVPSARPSSSGVNRRQSTDDAKGSSSEKWKCFLCSSKTIFGSWNETRTHCETVHKVNNQFMCLICEFTTDDVYDMIAHAQACEDEENKKKILVMFSKCETFDAEDVSQTAPVWKKNVGPVRHIHGNFTEDSVALIRQYNNQLSGEIQPASASSPLKSSAALPVPTRNPVKPMTTTTKARRSTSVSTSAKSGPIKTGQVPAVTSTQKSEVFKYRCHKCDMYKTKSPTELRVHLFNEFRYKRWMCLVCNLKFTTEKSLKGHIERDHQRVYEPDLYELQPENIEIEGEIDECIEKQNRKKEMINSFAVEKLGKLSCRHCKEDGYTYDTFETHILQKHSS